MRYVRILYCATSLILISRPVVVTLTGRTTFMAPTTIVSYRSRTSTILITCFMGAQRSEVITGLSKTISACALRTRNNEVHLGNVPEASQSTHRKAGTRSMNIFAGGFGCQGQNLASNCYVQIKRESFFPPLGSQFCTSYLDV